MTSSNAPAPVPTPPDRTTVLVVDDEDGIRQALTRFLSRLGYHVQAAANATEAVLMLTAIDEPRTAIECLKLGAYDYLIKPVDLEELELSLQHALRQRQLEVDRRELE